MTFRTSLETLLAIEVYLHKGNLKRGFDYISEKREKSALQDRLADCSSRGTRTLVSESPPIFLVAFVPCV